MHVYFNNETQKHFKKIYTVFVTSILSLSKTAFARQYLEKFKIIRK